VAFHDAATWLAQIGMFLVLGLLVTPTTLLDYALPGLLLAGFLILVARPATVFLCLAPFGFSRNEKLFFSWVGLRGAVPIVLAMFPLLAGIEHAREMFNVAFFVVLISLVVQGTTVAPFARWLRLDVRRHAQPRQRIELDVPGQTNYEVVGYTLEEDSAIVGKTLVSLPLPGSARIVGVIRRGALAPGSNRLRLRSGDHVYLIAPIRYVERLDQVFLTRDTARREEVLAGEFDVSGRASLADLLLLLGLDGLETQPDETVQSLFVERFAAAAEGQHLDMGDYRITVRKVDQGEIIAARVARRDANGGQ
ncbi:MAG: cation:proton antiporter, partial [Proteobacteria bacterium]|nr:cation:proton antiporter [Pseudomonadota bacterium]